jgi:hypothetical protein
MPELLNFTQYCVKNGYPSDYDTLFEAQYNGSLGLAGHVAKRTINKLHENANNNRNQNKIAHIKYTEAILNDEIIDPSGEIVKENILKYRRNAKIKELQNQISIGQGHIKFMLSLGKMSYTSSGKIKANCQRVIDSHQIEIDKAQAELNTINN